MNSTEKYGVFVASLSRGDVVVPSSKHVHDLVSRSLGVEDERKHPAAPFGSIPCLRFIQIPGVFWLHSSDIRLINLGFVTRRDLRSLFTEHP